MLGICGSRKKRFNLLYNFFLQEIAIKYTKCIIDVFLFMCFSNTDLLFTNETYQRCNSD